jgi:hypothetical protein
MKRHHVARLGWSAVAVAVLHIIVIAIVLLIVSARARSAPWLQQGGEQKPNEYGGKMAPQKPGPGKEATKYVKPLQVKRVLTVKGDEDWDMMTGFGKEADMAEMMILMMVGGSGMEHMKMAAMKPGMKMGDMKMPPKSSGPPVTATITPNPPIVGDNTISLTVNDPSGKPITGLNLSAAVGMTSMDMGTARPKFTEKDGRYTTTVNLSMKGPWRVTISGGDQKAGKLNTALDFNVGSSKRWAGTPASGKSIEVPPLVTKHAATIPAAKDSVPAPVTKDAAPAAATKDTAPAPAAKELDTGPKVTLNTPPDSVKMGKNTLDFIVLDPSGKPVTGAKVTGAVEMTSMDMGVAKPKAKEAKGGHYLTSVVFSMKGPWRVTLTVQPQKQKPFTKSFEFNVKM